jgi:drug/metabolite transporter (DMT)-like permease
MPRSNTTSYLMLVMAALIFASNHVIGRHLNEVLPPFGTAFWRFAIGAIVTLPFAGLAFIRNWYLIRAKFWFYLFLALLFVPLGNGLIYLSYHWTTATNGGVVTTVQPAVTVILSAIIFSDLINKKQGVGLIIATIGVIVILSKGNLENLLNLQFNIGDLTLILAMFSASLYNVLLRKVPKEITIPVLLFTVQILGTLVSLPIYLVETYFFRPMPVNGEIILTLLWIGIAVTSIAVGMNNAVVRNLGANKASISNYLRSLFTALLAILLIGEIFEIYHGIAFILVISGIWLLSMGRSINEN